MEIRPTILQQLSQALTPAASPATGLEPGGTATQAGTEASDNPRAIPEPIPNVRAALDSGDSSLILSGQEKNILEQLFVNQSEPGATTGFRLYSGQSPKPALRGSFVDLRG